MIEHLLRMEHIAQSSTKNFVDVTYHYNGTYAYCIMLIFSGFQVMNSHNPLSSALIELKLNRVLHYFVSNWTTVYKLFLTTM